MARALDGAIAELAPKTLGLLTYAQLDTLGVTRQRRRTLVANGVLEPVAARVVRHVAHPESWRPRLRWHIDLLRRDGVAGRPGLAAVDALLDRTEGRPLGDTWLEQEAIRLIEAAGLPRPRAQVKRRTYGGGIARVDLFWDTARLVVELAGHGTHATRRQRQRDDERAARLGLRGWRVVEFTYEDVVERPGYVVEIIRKYLSERT